MRTIYFRKTAELENLDNWCSAAIAEEPIASEDLPEHIRCNKKGLPDICLTHFFGTLLTESLR